MKIKGGNKKIMFENLRKNSITPIRENLNGMYRTRILAKLLTTELEALYIHPINQHDVEDMYRYIKAWVDSCLLYKKDYTLEDVLITSRRDDFDTAVEAFFLFTKDDPMQDELYIRNGNGRALFIKIFSLFI